MSKITLKKAQLRLTPKEEKVTQFISFDVPDGIKRLFITYSYTPKILEDKGKSYELIKENILRDAGEDFGEYRDYEEFMPLKNLVTLGLSSPECYIGAAHRQADSQHHEIGETFASPGFVRCRIIQGQWTLSLHAHAIVTDSCCCSIKIEGEAEE